MRLDYSPFFRTTVGFDRLLDLLENADTRAGLSALQYRAHRRE